MRYLFIAGLKLLGVLCLYWAIGDAVQIGTAYTSMQAFPAYGIKASWYLISIGGYATVHLLFALVLLFWPEAVATLLGMNDEDMRGLQISPQAMLYAALVGVSVYILLEASIPLLRSFFHLLEAHRDGRAQDAYQLSSLFATLCQIVLAFLVLGRARTIARTLVQHRG